MIGLIILLISALILGMVMDAAVDVRLSASAIHMAEKRIRSELTAQSLLELAVNALGSDRDRTTDTLKDIWADTIRAREFEYSEYIPDGANAVIIDLERYPPKEVLSCLGRENEVISTVEYGTTAWLNVLTAPRESWEAFGFTRNTITYLSAYESWENSTRALSVEVESIESRDRNIFDQLMHMNVFRRRSEQFLVRIDTTDGIFRAILRRSPVTGTVRLQSFERISA